MYLCGSLWVHLIICAFWTWLSVSFPQLGKFWTLLLQIFFLPFSLTFPSGIPTVQILEYLMLSQGSLLLSSLIFFFILLFWLGDFHSWPPYHYLFFSINNIAHFSYSLFQVGSLLHFYLFVELFSIVFSSLLSILMTVSLNSSLGKLSISDLFEFFSGVFSFLSFGAYSYASPFYLMFYVCSYEVDGITIFSSLERVVFV